MPTPLEIPHLSYEDLRRRADSFLQSYHPKKNIPIPIEEIIEFKFRKDIVPVPGLHQGFEIDGFLTSDLSTIYVDQFVYESRPGRYRFTLAHELAHAILHRRVYEAASFSTIKEWKRFVNEIDLRDYEWLEWQAYAFAGLILVPSDALKRKMADAIRLADARGLSIQKIGDVAKFFIASWLSKEFDVSSQVIEKRMEKDKLWPSAKKNTN
jgi:hypothetical protein